MRTGLILVAAAIVAMPSMTSADDSIKVCGGEEVTAIRLYSPQKLAASNDEAPLISAAQVGSSGHLFRVTLLSAAFIAAYTTVETQLTCTREGGIIVTEIFTIEPLPATTSTSEFMVTAYRMPLELDLKLHGKKGSIEGRWSSRAVDSQVLSVPIVVKTFIKATPLR
jgi:hypothetical protein